MLPSPTVLYVSDDDTFATPLDSSLLSPDETTVIRHVHTPVTVCTEFVAAAAVISCIVLAIPTAIDGKGAFVHGIYTQGINVPVVATTTSQEATTCAVEAGAAGYIVHDGDPKTMLWLTLRVEQALGECALTQNHRDRIEQQHVVSETRARVLTATDLDSTLDHAANRVYDILSASSAAISENLDGNALRVAATVGWPTNRGRGLIAAGGMQMVGIYQSGRSTLIDDFDDGERFEHATSTGPLRPESGVDATVGGDDTR